NRPYIHPFQL
uniref:Angiotensin I n=1 Tax=Triakis scyllium TaxID=30494 RepID=Q9PRY8_TRISC|nr:angiotensin I [Triakis scyllia=dogfish, plasma and kidney extracts, Peptide, 10 aa] [Triakis scyllium]